MMVYAFWFFLFLIGWFLFWLIVYWKGVAFVLLELPSMSTMVYILVIGGPIVAAFGLWWLIGLSPVHRSVALWVLVIVFLALTPATFYFLFKRRMAGVRMVADEIQNRIAGLKRSLERDPNDWGAYLGLARTYDKQHKLEEAIEAYSTALSLMGESPIRAKTQAQVEFLSKMLEKKRAQKTLSCRQCGTKNLPNNRFCGNCQSALYRTIFHWMSANLHARVKFALLGIVVLFSIFFFWVNAFWVVLLILLWCFDLVYFSLPVEFKN